jgi:hypothetical protein
MGIRFYCPLCLKKVHVKDHQAGLRGFCPKCRGKIDIPRESTRPSRREQQAADPANPRPTAARHGESGMPGAEPFDHGRETTINTILPQVGRLLSMSTSPPVDPLVDSPELQWYVVPPTGTDPFGPADGPTMQQWIGQGRVAPNSLVWRQDWTDWRKAGTVWSQLLLNVAAEAEREKPRLRPTPAPQFSALPLPSMPVETPPPQSLPPRAAIPMAATPNPTQLLPPAARVPASPPPPTAGSAPVGDGLYYPPRRSSLYWAIVAMLVVAIIALAIILVYLLDSLKRHPVPPTSPTEPTPAATASPIE